MPLQRKSIERCLINEHAAASRISKGSVEYSLEEARQLQGFPALMESFLAGRISLQHVRNILRAAGPVLSGINDGSIEPSVQGLFEQTAIEYAEHEAPGRTGAHVKELAAALAPQTVVQQNRNAEKERKTWMRTYEDGASLLMILLPTAKAQAIIDRSRTLGREALAASDTNNPDFHLPIDWDAEFATWQEEDTARRDEENARRTGYVERIWIPGEHSNVHSSASVDASDAGHWMEIFVSDDDEFAPSDEAWAAREAAEMAALEAGPEAVRVSITADERTLDQAQTDAICDLLLGGTPSDVIGSGLENVKAQVQVTINATTLAGLDDHPAQLDGAGPIDPDLARELAANNKAWTRLFLDETGEVTATDTDTPSAAIQKFLRARDQHCRFPGSRQPAHRCQIDHTLEYSRGGTTDVRNLAHLCVTHHALKHPDVDDRYRWTAVQHPDWTITWTSPHGHTYTDAPEKRVMFTPTGPDPADPPEQGTTAGRTATATKPRTGTRPNHFPQQRPDETTAEFWSRRDDPTPPPWEH